MVLTPSVRKNANPDGKHPFWGKRWKKTPTGCGKYDPPTFTRGAPSGKTKRKIPEEIPKRVTREV